MGAALLPQLHPDGVVTFRHADDQTCTFACRRRDSDGERFVVVPDTQIGRAPVLGWVRTCGSVVSGGEYLVPMWQWEMRVLPSGSLRYLE